MLCLSWGLVSVIQIFFKVKFQTGSSLTICLADLVKANVNGLGSLWLRNGGMRLGRWADDVPSTPSQQRCSLQLLCAAFFSHSDFFPSRTISAHGVNLVLLKNFPKSQGNVLPQRLLLE